MKYHTITVTIPAAIKIPKIVNMMTLPETDLATQI